MAQTNINLTEHSESVLDKFEALANINGLKRTNKEALINFALQVAGDVLTGLDDSDFEQLTTLKKSL
jgi:hypothetical protein